MSNYANDEYAYGAASAERAAATETAQRIADLEQQVATMEAEKADLRQRIVADIRTAAEDSAAINARLQAFNAEVTAGMSGEDIKRLARKHGL